jgi:plastocyanin
MRWLGGIVLAAVGGMALAACPAMAANQDVTATGGNAFSPQVVTINQGDTVTWRNAGGLHNVAFDDGSFIQPSPWSGAAWTVMRSFDTVGSFRYYCQVHGGQGGLGMSGTVVVAQAPVSGGGDRSNPSPSPVNTLGSQGQPTPCKSQRNFRIRIRQPRGVTIKSAEVSVNGKPVEVKKLVIDGTLRHTAQVDLRGLGKGTYTVAIKATTGEGKKLRGTRVYQTCAAKLTSSSLPAL